MKCLVINLDRSRDRLAHITAEFTRIGVAFERVKAIDARDRPELDHMPQNVLYKQRLRLTGGEIACLLSHRACWTIVAGDDAPYAAIFEDDAVFCARAGALLGNADWIPADADIIKLETFFQKTIVGRKRIPAGPGFSVSRLFADHMGTGGYIISKRTASDLIEASKEIRTAVDDLVFNPAFRILPRKTIYQLIPALCVQGQLLGHKTPELPSLLEEKRNMQWAVTATGEKRRKTAADRVRAEVRRLIRHIADFRWQRQRRVIPFHPPNAKD
jgi:glycosyl transferase family 25